MNKAVVLLLSAAWVSSVATGAAHGAGAGPGGRPASVKDPVALPAAPGQTVQRDFEAQAQAAPDGTIWATANIPLVAPSSTQLRGPDSRGTKLYSGADVWVSRDGGRSFRWVAAPFNPVDGQPGLAGEDADITVAPVRGASGQYTVSVVSLNLAASQLAWSTDAGKTWQVLPVAGTPVQDRPWVAADGPCLVHLSSRQIGSSEPVLQTFDTCSGRLVSTTLLVPVTDTTRQAAVALTSSNLLSRPTVDTGARSPYRGSLYVPMSQCTLPTDLVGFESSTGCSGGARVEHLLGVSRDQGRTFALHRVALQAPQRSAIAIWAMSVATDARGRVYVVWHDGADAWLQVSRDGGVTFTPPQRLNGASGSAAYPTVAARADGQVVVAAFVADRSGNVGDLARFGEPQSESSDRADWRLEMWRSADGGRTLRRVLRSEVVHRGVVCVGGSSCALTNGDRNLFDDFGLVALPDGSAVAVFDEDGGSGRLEDVRTVSVRLPG